MLNVVTAMTRNVYDWAVPFLRSLKHYNPDVDITILCEDDEYPLFPVKTINVSGQTLFPSGGVNYHNPYTYINLLKVAYPDILEYDKVIHLDIDTIICDSLEEMWNTDLKGKWFAAVPEYTGRYHPFGSLYFNAGVLLINLEQMRRDKIVPAMVEYLNTVRQPYADQDAWNKYALEQDKAVVLPIRYNETNMTGETFDPAIVHYCGQRYWWTDPFLPRGEYLQRWR